MVVNRNEITGVGLGVDRRQEYLRGSVGRGPTERLVRPPRRLRRH